VFDSLLSLFLFLSFSLSLSLSRSRPGSRSLSRFLELSRACALAIFLSGVLTLSHAHVRTHTLSLSRLLSLSLAECAVFDSFLQLRGGAITPGALTQHTPTTTTHTHIRHARALRVVGHIYIHMHWLVYIYTNLYIYNQVYIYTYTYTDILIYIYISKETPHVHSPSRVCHHSLMCVPWLTLVCTMTHSVRHDALACFIFIPLLRAFSHIVTRALNMTHSWVHSHHCTYVNRESALHPHSTHPPYTSAYTHKITHELVLGTNDLIYIYVSWV